MVFSLFNAHSLHSKFVSKLCAIEKTGEQKLSKRPNNTKDTNELNFFSNDASCEWECELRFIQVVIL